MWIQFILIGILFFILVVVIVIRLRYKKTYLIYQLNDIFDISLPSDELYQPFNELFVSTDKFQDGNIISFSDYGKIDSYIDKLPYTPETYVYAIKGSDLMADKATLAFYFMNNKLDDLIPKTYVLKENAAMDLKEGEIYFLKKNVQRQEGAMITKDIAYIKKSGYSDGYVVCQQLLQDPLLVGGRKVNMRVYMLIVCFPTVKIYFYNNGFMYYTSEKFIKNSTNKDVNITTGYIDRDVYEHNPLTHFELYEQLGDERSKLLQKNIVDLFVKFKLAYENDLNNANDGKKRFNVFGVDVAPDENLGVKIMEVNKAPDLSYKDDKDAAVKLKMVKDMMNLVGVFDEVGNKDNFILV